MIEGQATREAAEDEQLTRFSLVGRYVQYTKRLGREMLGEQDHTAKQVLFWQEELARSFDVLAPLLEAFKNDPLQHDALYAHALLREGIEQLQTRQSPLEAIYGALRSISVIPHVLQEMQDRLRQEVRASESVAPFDGVFPNARQMHDEFIASLGALPDDNAERDEISREVVRNYLQFERLGVLDPIRDPIIHQEIVWRYRASESRIPPGSQQHTVGRLRQDLQQRLTQAS